MEIALGLLSLWPYSLEYWIEHLLECFDVEHDPLPDCLRPLIQLVDMVCQRLLNSETPKPRTSISHTAHGDKDQRFTNLMKRIDSSVSGLIGEMRNVSSWTNDDQSPLARPMQAYQSVIESLMLESSVDSITPAIMLAFRELHGPNAFLCDIRGCDHTIIGFPSKEKLNNHQMLHSQELKCFEMDCSYNDIGFESELSLRNHRKRCHETVEPDQVVKRLRRVPNALPEVGYQDINDNNDWDYIINPEVPRMLTVARQLFIPTADIPLCTSFSPDGKRIAVCTRKAAFIFEIRTGLLLWEFSHNGRRKYRRFDSVCFSPDGNYLATGSHNGLVRVRCYLLSVFEHG